MGVLAQSVTAKVNRRVRLAHEAASAPIDPNDPRLVQLRELVAKKLPPNLRTMGQGRTHMVTPRKQAGLLRCDGALVPNGRMG